MNTLIRILTITTLAMTISCSGKAGKTAAEPAATRNVPVFSADSAYAYIERQVSFGPRVPGSDASAGCAAWMEEWLREHGAEVTVQHATARRYDGVTIPMTNISASYKPQAQKRILLVAHWDSRPWADMETDPVLREQPIDGANDGASGVGVLMEIARQLSLAEPQVGVDILLVDAEDSGRREDDPGQDEGSSSWCLGSQYWVQYPTIDLSNVRYAILLDMVGGRDARFPREYFSDRYASNVVDLVWEAAAAAGHSDRFTDEEGTAVMDDHVPLLSAGIQAIDIIETLNPETDGFNPTWHTHADNIGNIDRATLGAVGQTLMQLLY